MPAATILLLAHAELEKLVGTIHQNQLKPTLDQRWAYLVYAGLWWEPLRADLDAYMDAANAQVTGTIGVKLYKGSARVVTRESPNAVYDAQLATFARVRRPVLAGRRPGVHRAVVAAVADGLARQARRERVGAAHGLSTPRIRGLAGRQVVRAPEVLGRVAARSPSPASRRRCSAASSRPAVRPPHPPASPAEPPPQVEEAMSGLGRARPIVLRDDAGATRSTPTR